MYGTDRIDSISRLAIDAPSVRWFEVPAVRIDAQNTPAIAAPTIASNPIATVSSMIVKPRSSIWWGPCCDGEFGARNDFRHIECPLLIAIVVVPVRPPTQAGNRCDRCNICPA